ncbi:MAG: DnaB-like helicase C-terminal domain-containing protein [Methanogenium sp.]|jgi:replicative DNA helicase
MKQSDIDTSIERKIIEGLIYNDDFVKRIQPVFDPKYMKTRISKMISNYCISYYDKYSIAPKSEIKSLININAVESKSEDDLEALETLVESISDKKDDHYNLNYWVEKAETYFNRRKLDILSDSIKESVSSDDVTSAELEIANHKNIRISENSGFSLIRDRKKVKEILMHEDDEMFAFPKDLGKLIGSFVRGDLVAFIGPGKRGKTWILIETAIQAMMRKYKVLLISLEMNDRSIIKRCTQNIFSESIKEEEFMVPRFVKNGEEFEIDCTRIEKRKGLKVEMYDRKISRFLPQIGSGDLRIKCYPAYSADYKKIFADIELLEITEGWTPDFIIIDYADLIAPESQKGDRRDQIDTVWKRLRALAQIKNCSVVTATHSNKQTFERNIKQNDLSDDNRKINHVGKMISLNQTFSEKKVGAMRMQMIAERNGYFDDTEVVVLQCLHIGKPFLDVMDKDKIENYADKYQKKN